MMIIRKKHKVFHELFKLHLVFFFTAVLCILGQFNVLWASENWERFKSCEKIDVYIEKNKSPVKNSFKAVTTINQPIEVVGPFVADIASYDKWIDKCQEVKVIERNTPQKCMAYLAINAPWPINSREVIFNIKTDINLEKQKIDVKGVALSEIPFFYRSKYMRIVDAKYQTKLEGIGLNKTQITYKICMNPGGNLPSFITEPILGNIVYASVRNLRILLEGPSVLQDNKSTIAASH